MRQSWLAALIGLLLLVGPAAFLFDGDGRLRLRLDPSTATISGSAEELDQHLYLVLRSASPIDADAIEELSRFSQRARRLKMVKQLHSITQTEIPFGADDALLIDTLPGRLRAEPDAAEYWIDTAFNDPLVRHRLVSADRHAALLVFEASDGELQAIVELGERIREALQADVALNERFDWWLSGAPLVQKTISGLLLKQMLIILPAIIFIFVLILALAFRSLVVVLGSLLTVAAAVAWTLAVAVMSDLALNLVTILAPPLVLTLTVAFCMHIVAAHAEQSELGAGLKSVRTPLVMSAITTAAGLAGLIFNPVPAIQQFAWLGVAGTLFAALCAYFVLPLALARLAQAPAIWPPLHNRFIRSAEALAAMVLPHSKRALQLGAAALVVCLVGASQVETGANFVEDLPASSEARQSLNAISRDFGGTTAFDINIAGAGRDSMLHPDVLRAVEELEDWLRAQAGISDSLSLVDYVKRVNQAMTDGRPENFRIPDDPALIKQLMLIAAPEESFQYTDYSFSSLRIHVVSRYNDTRDIATLLESVRQRLKELPPGLAPRISGDAAQIVNTVQRLTSGQVQALGFAILSIFTVLAIMFASLRVAALALLPNLLPVAVFFALLGFSGTPLGPTTALVACIVMGIAVDDTLHFLGRFNHLARALADEERACRQAIREVIRPITLTTVIVCTGFLCLLTSPFRSHITFGLFCATTLILAWLSDLMLAPAVSVRAHIVTLWDRLRLDIGPKPHLSIPLFDGMTERQARTFGLLASVRQIPAGQTFIQSGDADDRMYVVIDGEIRVWIVDEQQQEVELARLSRGAMIGESAQFTSLRSANVAAMTPVRLLQFDPGMLDKIGRRYARIGSLIHRNINRAQAHRLLTANQRLAGAGIAPIAS